MARTVGNIFTEAQQEIRDKFKESTIYAKAVMQNPELKTMYAQAATGDQTAYNLALRDASVGVC